jgi:hypothetical protein
MSDINKSFLGLGVMRFGVLVALFTGGGAIVSGLIGFFLKLPDSAAIIAAGAGLISLALGSKAFQAQAEKDVTP